MSPFCAGVLDGRLIVAAERLAHQNIDRPTLLRQPNAPWQMVGSWLHTPLGREARLYYSTTTRLTSTLTHVNQKGEARMVDVGDKISTRRIAIANTVIAFSNELPLEQIRNNTNKKGDVLSIARVAGIMAAKKTSEMIPLCHPIMISKVSLNLRLQESTAQADTVHGAITVESRVECIGQTGVEMEALSAATTAALTIYDMCKAVDRDMTILNARVVYKSGGKSGTHICQQWLKLQDETDLRRQGLDVG